MIWTIKSKKVEKPMLRWIVKQKIWQEHILIRVTSQLKKVEKHLALKTEVDSNTLLTKAYSTSDLTTEGSRKAICLKKQKEVDTHLLWLISLLQKNHQKIITTTTMCHYHHHHHHQIIIIQSYCWPCRRRRWSKNLTKRSNYWKSSCFSFYHWQMKELNQ